MRKTVTVTIGDEGRDLGRMFEITEMSSDKAEWWAIRVLQALARAGLTLPAEMQAQGWGMLISFGYPALRGIAASDLKPLLDEMVPCIRVLSDPNDLRVTMPLAAPILPEEVLTWVKLRKAWWDLHAGFLKAVDLSAFRVPEETAEATPSTSTSPEP